jgi:hypothetical protein
MQGHGDNAIHSEQADARIAETLAQHPPEEVTQMKMLVVFEVMDELAHSTATPVSRGGKIEG